MAIFGRAFPIHGIWIGKPQELGTASTYTLQLDAGSYVITGQASAFALVHVLRGAAGSYSVTGSAVLLAEALPGAIGSYSVTGSSAQFLRTYILSGVAGHYIVTGSTAQLQFQMSTNFVLSGQVGSYNVTGLAARFAGIFRGAAGGYAITGHAVAFIRGHRLLGKVGAYGATGRFGYLSSSGAFRSSGTVFELQLNNSSAGIPPFSSRGISQTLKIANCLAAPRRTNNGVLIDVAFPQFRKYSSRVTCKDQRIPAIDGMFRGMAVTISCIEELAYQTGGTPSRDAVPGSVYTEGDFTFYRPVLNMLVTDISTQTDEWSADVQWEFDFEEV